jgi:hypothetical protein
MNNNYVSLMNPEEASEDSNNPLKFLGRETELTDFLEKCHYKLRESAEFGAKILCWDIETQAGGDEKLPPLLFLRNQIELLEAASILVKESLIEPCYLLLRSLIETYFYLSYIFEKDTDRRSLCFIVWDLQRTIQLLHKSDGTSAQAKEATAMYSMDKALKSSAFVYEKAQEQIRIRLDFLSKPKYKAINEEYERVSRKTKSTYWFSLFEGPKSIKQLARQLELPGVYDGFYGILSNSIHGTDIIRNKLSSNGKGQLEVKQIRLPNGIRYVMMSFLHFSDLSFEIYLKNRAPQKMNIFGKWVLKNEAFIRELPPL